MTLKDNISTKGIETTCVQKFSQAISRFITQPFGKTLAGENAVMLGKTNMDEFDNGLFMRNIILWRCK